MKKHSSVSVSARALIQRINRKLKSGGTKSMLKAVRGERARQELGDFFIVDGDRNFVVADHVDLVETGRRLGVLAQWEKLADETHRGSGERQSKKAPSSEADDALGVARALAGYQWRKLGATHLFGRVDSGVTASVDYVPKDRSYVVRTHRGHTSRVRSRHKTLDEAKAAAEGYVFGASRKN